ncbi:PepSY-associated TM helix domain-containing protein [Streptomyces sp. CRN 30]|uniref:PepSY-associated TM helix domain-containing protein n=1 Tax=Streptomyces sp. CRN 30 TaxID=3075613 RepID=UPI002A814816|nr:PepSY-associated TM helix domain-containing protein [Streptomyces sp. CRN 30]
MSTAPSAEKDESPESPGRDPSPEPAAGQARTRAALTALVLRLHFYAGVLVAPFLLVAALTGALYAASYPLEKIMYADELTVPAVGERKLPISEQVAAAREEHPEGALAAVRPSPKDDATTRVMLSGVPGTGEDNTLAVFVDPYTAEVRGSLEQYGSTGALPVRTWIDRFHRDLHLGEPGRLYSELAASWLWVIAAGGLVLWFGRRRARRKVRGTSGRRRVLGLHGTVGAWAALGFFFLSATGLTWSAYAGANIATLRDQIRQATPTISASVGDHAVHEGHGDAGEPAGAEHEGDLDDILAAARAEGLGDPVEIVPPADASTGYVVQQVQRSWPSKQDAVAVDPVTAEVTDTIRFDDFPVLAKLARWGIDAHMGTLFGLPNQLVLIALGLSLAGLVLLGYRMWWQRGRGSAFGRPIPRGAWQQVPPQILVPALVVVAVLGYFVPLLGIPLAVFIAVDVVLGEIAHRRGERSYAR